MKQIKKYAFFLLALAGIGLTQSCQNEIDMSDRYTFTTETITGYLEKHADYSEYVQLLSETPISKRSASNVKQLLSARGNYTVFAPSNDAIQEYLDTLCNKGLISSPSWDGFPNETVLDSIRKVIVYNSIIDGGDNISAYQTSGFPEDTEEFPTMNMNERKLTINYGNNPDSMYINGLKDPKTGIVEGGCLIDLRQRDIIASNGFVHQVHSVVAPSNDTMADILKSFMETGEDYAVTAMLVEACGLFPQLSQVKDEVYEEAYLSNEVPDLAKHPSFESSPGYMPQHRKYGFTIFAETDSFWCANLGKASAKDITLDDVREYVVAQNFYPNATNDKNYTDENNVLNQFITYHILPMRIPVDKLVIHYNEKGYNEKTSKSYTVATWELYTTMGKRRLFKLYQAPSPEGIYINRFPVLDNGRHGTFKEVSCDVDKEGIFVNTKAAQGVINGYIYPIDRALAYNDDTQANFQKQRLRFDAAALFPEFMNNDIRVDRKGTKQSLCVGMPVDLTYQYLEDLEIGNGTKFYYLSGCNRGWQNYQGDELNVTGLYEMTLRLPPVPKRGIYEIRYAVQTNSEVRGMCQVYFGTNKKALPAMGIPLDLRMGGEVRRTSAGQFESIVGWELDKAEDDDYNAEVDKKMRNNGFMKGPEHYAAGGPGTASMARSKETLTRRIIVREEMDPNKTYYLKFKSVLKDETREFYMDYIEFCAKEVYDNPMTPEDIW
ncbi:MAG: fasciclin domain-containing protein [Bacteroidaceae bacterium]|nr:fasciclin domain-containing protein [Bacteroidaceae bacterium]